MMRKILVHLASLLVLAGFSASSFAVVNVVGVYSSVADANTACVSSSINCSVYPATYSLPYGVNGLDTVGSHCSDVAVVGNIWGEAINNLYCYSTCAPGQVADSGGQCVPACPTNPAITISDSACQPCPTGQMMYEGACVPDCASRAGSTGRGEYELCKVAPGTYPVLGQGGCPTAAEFQGRGFQDGGCIIQPVGNFVCQSYSDGSVTCKFDYSVSSKKAPMSDTAAGTPSVGTSDPRPKDTSPHPPSPPSPPPVPVDVAPPPPTCPPGYSLSAGVCVSATQPQNQPPTCPPGFTLVGGTSCVGADPQLSCPSGFVLNAARKCESLADLAAVKKGATTSCGGVGQPACKSSLGQDGVLDAIQKSINDSFGPAGVLGKMGKSIDDGFGADGVMAKGFDSLKNLLTAGTGSDAPGGSTAGKEHFDNVKGVLDSLGSGAGPSHGWGLSLPSIFPQAAVCSPWVFMIGGGVRTIDPCPTVSQIRSIAEFCLYVFTLFGLFRILFGSRSISRG